MLHPKIKRIFFLCLVICAYAFTTYSSDFPLDAAPENSSNKFALNEIKKLNFATSYKTLKSVLKENDYISIKESEFVPIQIDTNSMVKIHVSCNGNGSDGSISGITATGGSGSLNFSWSNGMTGPDISNLSAGDYVLTVSDPAGIETSDSRTITINSPISSISIDQITRINPSCNGGSDGSISFTFSNAPPTYDISWFKDGSPISSNQTFVNNLSVGSYSVVISDLGASPTCSLFQDFEITEPEIFDVVPGAVVDPLCFGSVNGGIATFNVSGGTLPYYYSIDGNTAVAFSTNTITITGLLDGAHTISIYDTNNCNTIAPFNVLITEPLEITIDPSIVEVTPISCFGANDGIIMPASAVSGGMPPYTYTWSGPGGTFFTENITGLQPGNYDVNVTDANGCISATETFTVGDKLELQITNVSVPITDLLCAGDTNASFSIITAEDPSSILLIEWFLNGNLINSGTDKSISNLGVGTYHVVVTDSNSTSACSVTAIQNITEPSLFGAFITDSTDPLCFDDPNGASVEISLGGGTAPYFYTIDGAAPISVNASPLIITNLTDGFHIIEVTDTNGCNPVTFNHQVSFPSEIAIALQQVDITGITCFGAGDGTISMNNSVSGGTIPYSYTWTGPVGTTNFGASLVNLIPGDYVLNIADLNGCIAEPITFNVPDKLALEITGSSQPIDRLQCAGDENGSIAIQIGKDPSSNIEIEWFKNGTSYNTANTDNIINLGAGIYEVIVTDLNAPNCSDSKLFEITEPEVFNAEISSFTDPLCFDDAAGGSLTLVFSGGTLPYNYSLDGGQSITVDDTIPVVLTGLTDGAHNIFLTDSNGCNAQTLPHLVSYPAEIQIDYDPLTDILPVECGSGGAISVFVTGGTGTNYFYVWDGPSLGQSGFNLSTISNLENGGVYNLTVFDENSCESVKTSFVVPDFPEPFTVSSVVNQQTCPTGNGNGSIQLSLGIDLIAPYFIVWEKWALTDPTDVGCFTDCYSWQVIPNSSDKIVINGLDAGEYRTIITDSGSPNCNEQILTFTIFENALEVVSDELELPTCTIADAYYKFNLNNVGDVDFSLNGSPISVGGPLLTLNQVTHEYSLQLISLATPTNYLLKITEQIPNGDGTFTAGCEVFENFVIDPYIPITFLGATTSVVDMCEESPLFKIEDLQVTGGTPFVDENGDAFYTYEWFGPNDFHSFGAEIPAVIGEYTLRIGDNVSCESEPITITLIVDNEAIVVTSEIGDVSCDEQADGFISIEIAGGKEPYTVVWEEEIPSTDPGSSDPTYNVIGQDLLRLNSLVEGRYRLTVTSDLAACTTDNPAFQFQEIYTVGSSHTIAIIEGPFLDEELCAGNPGTLTIKVSDTRSGPISFYYNGELVGGEDKGDNTYLIVIANPVENSILDVLNELGCGEAIAFDIGLGDPSFITSSSGYDFNGVVNLQEEVTFTNTSTDPYTRLEWDFDDGSELVVDDEAPKHVFLTSGAYDVTVRIYNDLGCFKEFTEIIRVGEEFYVIFPDVFTPNNDGVNDFFFGEIIGINSFEFEIYDLWNNLLFAKATNSSNAGNWGWDGKLSDGSDFNGKVFKYYFKGIDTNGRDVIISNQALLLR